jgi:hypothetical protein
MDHSGVPSPRNNDFGAQPIPSGSLERQVMLTGVRDWCMQRLSELSLAGQIDDARALTAEHLELLEVVNRAQTLWMVVEDDG